MADKNWDKWFEVLMGKVAAAVKPHKAQVPSPEVMMLCKHPGESSGYAVTDMNRCTIHKLTHYGTQCPDCEYDAEVIATHNEEEAEEHVYDRAFKELQAHIDTPEQEIRELAVAQARAHQQQYRKVTENLFRDPSKFKVIQGEVKMRCTVDPMRRKSRTMSATELKRIDKIKKLANKLYSLIEEAEDNQRPGYYGYEFDQAQARLEECVMWATKAISG